jgi:hypothetical protein
MLGRSSDRRSVSGHWPRKRRAVPGGALSRPRVLRCLVSAARPRGRWSARELARLSRPGPHLLRGRSPARPAADPDPPASARHLLDGGGHPGRLRPPHRRSRPALDGGRALPGRSASTMASPWPDDGARVPRHLRALAPEALGPLSTRWPSPLVRSRTSPPDRAGGGSRAQEPVPAHPHDLPFDTRPSSWPSRAGST